MTLKKKLAVVALVGIMGATAGLGTLAYFTATDAKENVFTVGNIGITLTEPTWVAEGSTLAQTMVPGREIPKDPTVTVKQESVNSYIRLVLTGTEDFDTYFEIQGLDTENWKLVEGAIAGKTVYEYKEVVEATGAEEKTLPALFEKVRLSTDLTTEANLAEADLKLNVEAYAVQSEGFDGASKAFIAAFGNVFSA